jgi:hypothetical protein
MQPVLDHVLYVQVSLLEIHEVVVIVRVDGWWALEDSNL